MRIRNLFVLAALLVLCAGIAAAANEYGSGDDYGAAGGCPYGEECPETSPQNNGGSGGSSGGSGGGGSPPPSVPLSDIGGSKKVTLPEGSTNKFVFRGESHSLTVEKIDGQSVLIMVASEAQDMELTVGKIGYFDLTGEGVYDLAVELLSISFRGAELEIKELKEQETIKMDSVQERGAAESTDETKDEPGPGPGIIQASPTGNTVKDTVDEGTISWSVFWVVVFALGVTFISYTWWKKRKEEKRE